MSPSVQDLKQWCKSYITSLYQVSLLSLASIFCEVGIKMVPHILIAVLIGGSFYRVTSNLTDGSNDSLGAENTNTVQVPVLLVGKNRTTASQSMPCGVCTLPRLFWGPSKSLHPPSCCIYGSTSSSFSLVFAFVLVVLDSKDQFQEPDLEKAWWSSYEVIPTINS